MLIFIAQVYLLDFGCRCKSFLKYRNSLLRIIFKTSKNIYEIKKRYYIQTKQRKKTKNYEKKILNIEIKIIYK